jgi:UDP-N-acetylmuramyl pentapeptide phosphotransferase/UDP-N-acetylglucosamine-1-phosphate transferase
VTAFLITVIAIPPIVRFARRKGIYGKRSGRDTHTINIPTLGGVAIFAGFIIAFITFSRIVSPGALMPDGIHIIITGTMVILITGMIDDIRNVKPVWKLIGEIIAVSILIFWADIRITSFYGLFGINEIGYLPGILFTLLIFLVIVNSFNLIDGIDGLATGIGIIASISFGLIFYFEKQYLFVLLAAGLIGSLTAFFYFNVFSKTHKILMGDTGSLIIGLMQAVMAVHVMEFESSPAPAFHSSTNPAIVFAILIIPVFDIIRVAFLRIIHGRSPLRADRRHIHYRLLELGLTHIQTSGILIFINILFILLVSIAGKWEINKLTGLIFVIALLIFTMPFCLLRKTKDK